MRFKFGSTKNVEMRPAKYAKRTGTHAPLVPVVPRALIGLLDPSEITTCSFVIFFFSSFLVILFEAKVLPSYSPSLGGGSPAQCLWSPVFKFQIIRLMCFKIWAFYNFF